MSVIVRTRKTGKALHFAFLFIATVSLCELHVGAQEDVQKPTEKPAAVTTSDPQIPVENLDLLVKPLTKEELAVEADAWRDLLKRKVQEISERQIAVK